MDPAFRHDGMAPLIGGQPLVWMSLQRFASPQRRRACVSSLDRLTKVLSFRFVWVGSLTPSALVRLTARSSAAINIRAQTSLGSARSLTQAPCQTARGV
jgi:hypothetical protein